ncbi:DNA-directed RNA polymerases i and iii subunit rpac1 [Anaeramoeba flamelloides]|uniref:DNA-directed RNA polymerases i and iii subunit rpac1 n=1 Tax=Anaeramoeba flamelloides TaxID=1746091 RepID=A0ABQ8Y006_9EUKA|nr:DNA-directed RNA polymerases i and iii subunit rpac1 [Anaeramoeba flamelloides]
MSIHVGKEKISQVLDGEILEFNPNNFSENFSIEIEKLTKDRMEFVMRGIEAPLANAFRRILLSDIPTIAIETISIKNNTSVIQDEVLAHRLGLIPINVDPKHFQYRPKQPLQKQDKNSRQESSNATEENTLLFNLHIRCLKKTDWEKIKKSRELLLKKQEQNKEMNLEKDEEEEKKENQLKIQIESGSESEDEEEEGEIDERAKECVEKILTQRAKTLINHRVLSSDLVWVPIGNQQTLFPKGIKPVLPDILIAKLNEGQEIDVECEAVKGTGREHAKWCPVCTASYRMLPSIKLKKQLSEKQSKKLVKTCPMKVFDIEDGLLEITNSRKCTMCRECLRGDYGVELGLVKNEFYFWIESTGIIPPEELFQQALEIFKEKCINLKNNLQNFTKKKEFNENEEEEINFD